jgi:hypothetical protein
LRFDNKKIAQWNLRTNEQKRIKNLVKSPRTILTIYYKYFCGTDNMAQINQINQLIDRALELDDSVVAMISMLKAIFWKMIMSPIISLIFPSFSLESKMIIELILAVIGLLIWNQLDDNIDTFISEINALICMIPVIMSPILWLIFPSFSLKSTMIFEVILAAIGKLIFNQVIQQSDQAEQLYNQAIHLRSLPSLDGDQNR